VPQLREQHAQFNSGLISRSEKQLPLQPWSIIAPGVLNASRSAGWTDSVSEGLSSAITSSSIVRVRPDDKLYLACITIKNGKVSRSATSLCASTFTCFPTVEYWLSVIPIIPVIRKRRDLLLCGIAGILRQIPGAGAEAETANATRQNT
jgi:hypothetical protein